MFRGALLGYSLRVRDWRAGEALLKFDATVDPPVPSEATTVVRFP
jgi:hypothetical protein